VEFRNEEIVIELGKQGELRHRKVSYPLLVGTYHKITLPGYVFFYDLKGDIKYIRGLHRDWPHPSEWLKRSKGGYWVYYFSGRYTEDLFDYLGEYYLPCFPYQSNSLWRVDTFAEESVQRALSTWEVVPGMVEEHLGKKGPSPIRDLVRRIGERGREALQESAKELLRINGDEVRVLPPDTRHVDYEVLPLFIAEGCLYDCAFCRVKSGRSFQSRSRENVRWQLRELENLLGEEEANLNAVFLGQDDALHAGTEKVTDAAEVALQSLRPSPLWDRYVFFFGSVDSLLAAEDKLWSNLAELPCRTYVNIGLESGDQETLDRLGKPLRAELVREAFSRMLDLNERHANLEVSANFLLDPDLPSEHWTELERLLREVAVRPRSKGAIYLSPMRGGRKREHMRLFQPLKMRSKLPLYLYLIQRL